MKKIDLLPPQLEVNDWEALEKLFDQYLLHGGYLTAINDFALNQTISINTLNTYSDWIRGDMLKRGKQEEYLKEILKALFKTYGCQITWNGLAKSLSIDHPATVADYLLLLENWIAGETPDFNRNPLVKSQLIEAVCIAHFRRYYPTFYINAEGEVDIAYLKNSGRSKSEARTSRKF